LDSSINKISDDLYLIPLVPPIAGFNDFIGVWLNRGRPSFLVDVGPSATAGALLRALRETDTNHLDFILLTHIHLDHAGAIGEIAEKFPDTPIICHPEGIHHLVNPARLWEATLKILGATARAYGPIKPVSTNRFHSTDDFQSDAIKAVRTPGHSIHHVSYLTESHLYIGEAGGVCLSLPDHRQYLRPATPPRLFLDTALKSIETLIAKAPPVACYGHFGLQHDAMEKLKQQRQQLLLWNKVIKAQFKLEGSDNFMQVCLNKLLAEDPLLEGFKWMPPDIQEREVGFLTNSIKGFLSYLNFEL